MNITQDDKPKLRQALAGIVAEYAKTDDPVKRADLVADARKYSAPLRVEVSRYLDEAVRIKRHVDRVKADKGAAAKELKRVEADAHAGLLNRLKASLQLVAGGDVEKLGRAVASVEELLRTSRANAAVAEHLDAGIKQTRELRERYAAAKLASDQCEQASAHLARTSEDPVNAHVVKLLSK